MTDLGLPTPHKTAPILSVNKSLLFGVAMSLLASCISPDSNVWAETSPTTFILDAATIQLRSVFTNAFKVFISNFSSSPSSKSAWCTITMSARLKASRGSSRRLPHGRINPLPSGCKASTMTISRSFASLHCCSPSSTITQLSCTFCVLHNSFTLAAPLATRSAPKATSQVGNCFTNIRHSSSQYPRLNNSGTRPPPVCSTQEFEGGLCVGDYSTPLYACA
ncbi:hypothetical protein CCR75_004093 [Bremia lactucae]|uniref:Uncharacterized protein n=1 Tax=Bremia lactucae TaxID=4779 RepID=A0A976IJ80_BRELC|nr:hypothetical protein CCR75_004093 [Bremia lactucae]